MILEATHTFKIQDSNMFCKECCPPAVQFKRCYEDNKVDKFYVYNAVPQFSFLSVAAGIFFSSMSCQIAFLFLLLTIFCLAQQRCNKTGIPETSFSSPTGECETKPI